MDTGSQTHDASGIAVTTGRDDTVVTMWGEVDASLRERASEAMGAVLGNGGRVVVDAAAVTFIDSSGIAFIIQLYMLGEEEQRDVVLLDPPPGIVEMLDVIGMGGRIPVEHSEPSALLG